MKSKFSFRVAQFIVNMIVGLNHAIKWLKGPEDILSDHDFDVEYNPTGRSTCNYPVESVDSALRRAAKTREGKLIEVYLDEEEVNHRFGGASMMKTSLSKNFVVVQVQHMLSSNFCDSMLHVKLTSHGSLVARR